MASETLIVLDTDIFETLEDQRSELCSIARHYGSEFPGSKGHAKAVAAENTIKAFDIAHPEIVAAINAAKDAAKAVKAGWI